MSITEQMLHLSNGQFWIFFGLAVIASLAGFFFAFRNLNRARTIEDIPTAKIRSAQQGYVELNGQALDLPDNPVIAPLSGKPCCWFRYKIERRNDKSWRSLESKTSAAAFLIADETGQCIINPEGAEITPSDKRVWHGSSRYPEGWLAPQDHKTPSTLQRVGDLLNSELGVGSRYRYTEEYIYPGDMIYSIGLFKSLDDMDHQQSRSAIATRILRDWKADQAGLLRRFDTNRSGSIEMDEWEQARESARQLAEMEHRQQLHGQSLHSLGATGSHKQPFLISTLPEFDLVKHYRHWAGFSMALFFAFGIGAILMFFLRVK